jgi:hypothetical protein
MQVNKAPGFRTATAAMPWRLQNLIVIFDLAQTNSARHGLKCISDTGEQT